MILGRDLLTALGMYLKFYENFIIGVKVPHERCSAHIIDIRKYKFYL